MALAKTNFFSISNLNPINYEIETYKKDKKEFKIHSSEKKSIT